MGTGGYLYVMKDIGLKEPFIGTTEIVSGEIAEDITNYFAVSEQTPSVCALGVLVNPDLSVNCAGGFIIQLLPGCPEETIAAVEKALSGIPSVTQMLADGMNADAIAKRAMQDIPIDKLDESSAEYRCNCSRERVEAALISTGPDSLKEMAESEEDTKVECHFCDKEYIFTSADINYIIEKSIEKN